MLINRLELKKVLSFRDSTVELGQLNVLIGPNAVGKSNLIEVIGLLQAAPAGFVTAILRSGGARQWIWLGDRDPDRVAEVVCELDLTRGRQRGPVKYGLQFSEDANSNVPVILRESIGRVNPDPGSDGVYLNRESIKADFGPEAVKLLGVEQPQMFLSPAESVLAQFKNPADPTPITEVGNHFARIRIFREFRTGPQSPARWGIATNAQKGELVDGGDNLALVLNELIFHDVHERITAYLRRFCERFEDLKISVGEGLARAFLREAGLVEMLSAIRMSDGTLKFLCLLAALFNPSPPPLMCIEEPEIGLHPDTLPLVAEALMEASESMQLIVTTHSDALVDALTDRPESVLVCERDFDNGTQMKRLSKKDLKKWLDQYTLGQLWRKGEIGGGRW
jgi:predicted ATPase